MSSKSEKIIIGLTGGIACGKSTAGKFFHELGWELTSTDQIVSHLLDEDDEVISDIKSRWGDIVWQDSSLERKEIGSIVFRDPNERKWLESILHPKVRSHWSNAVEDSHFERIIVEIPLLFENNLEENFNYTICVFALNKHKKKDYYIGD